MPIIERRPFCTVFHKTAEEQKNYDARKELQATQEQLENTTSALNNALKLIEELSNKVDKIENQVIDNRVIDNKVVKRQEVLGAEKPKTTRKRTTKSTTKKKKETEE